MGERPDAGHALTMNNTRSRKDVGAKFTRRSLLLGSAVAGSAAVVSRTLFTSAAAEALAPFLAPAGGKTVTADLEIAERMTALPCFNGKSLPLWSFAEGAGFPVIRMKLGDTLDAHVKNALPRAGEHVTIHWHGLRVANASDGVPYVTQTPIQPGGEGRYTFVPPDTGTYFFHTHCNTVDHFGRGLIGALIVEGDEVQKSDHEIVAMMKDWHIAADGGFAPFTSDDGAAKAGTAGRLRSINGEARPAFKVPAAANVRLRLLNVDPVRISEIGIEGAEAAIIAVDGNACVPISLLTWRFGPAQRLDILMRSPKTGKSARLVDYFAPEPVVLADFVSEGPAARKDTFKAHALRAGRGPSPDLTSAERITLDFSATATGAAVSAAGEAGLEVGALCLSKRSFWAINKQAWASVDHKDLGPPLATLQRGKSYIIELKNLTSHAHPIHLHGHTFEVLSSNLRKLPPHRADTVLLVPKERVEVAFVADNPGRWMLHCHILEHQETGMMGYISVT
ncbi:MAG: multicopper oxidase family protein [Hyphomicrobium sp.]